MTSEDGTADDAPPMAAETPSAANGTGGNPYAGINGIQLQWPPHPGQHGIEGARKHRAWKQHVMLLRSRSRDESMGM